MKGIIHCKPLERGQTVTGERYEAQVNKLADVLKEKRPFMGQGTRSVLLLHDNANPYTAKLTKEAIFKLGWEVLPHEAYSPDLAPSDYCFFKLMQSYLADQRFSNVEDVRK